MDSRKFEEVLSDKIVKFVIRVYKQIEYHYLTDTKSDSPRSYIPTLVENLREKSSIDSLLLYAAKLFNIWHQEISENLTKLIVNPKWAEVLKEARTELNGYQLEYLIHEKKQNADQIACLQYKVAHLTDRVNELKLALEDKKEDEKQPSSGNRFSCFRK